MNKLYFFILLTSSLNLAAQAPKFENIKIDIDAPRVSFFETIEHIEVIRLEETESSLLEPIWGYFKTTKGIAIRQAKKVVLFDSNGNFNNAIDRFGGGPEEYINISDVWFNNGRIELFSGGSRVLQHYSEDGEYLNSLSVSYQKGIIGGAMMPYQDGYLFAQRSPYGVNTEVANYGLVFTDSNLNIIGKGAFLKRPNPFFLNLGKRFSVLDQSIFYKRRLNDSVFQIIDAKAYARFKFDFGDKWAWSNPESIASIQNASKAAGRKDRVIEVLPYIGVKQIMLAFYLSPTNIHKGYINRETGKYFRFDMRKKDKEDYQINFLQWEGDRLVSSIAAYDFEEFMENLDKDQWTVKGGFSLDEILSSENPVLLKIKFK